MISYNRGIFDSLAVSGCFFAPCEWSGVGKYVQEKILEIIPLEEQERLKTYEYSKELFIKTVKDQAILLVCPEGMGGLSCPRSPAEIEPGKTGTDVVTGNARIFTKEGDDVTDYFLKGAEKVASILHMYDIRKYISKDNSPSCGVDYIYDGTFSGNIKKGVGVTSAMLMMNNIDIIPGECIDDYLIK